MRYHAFGAVAHRLRRRLVFVRGYVSAGFLELAEEQPLGYVLAPLPHTGGDLYGLVVRGDSMTGAGIYHGQIVLIRRQRTFRDGDIVVAAVGGQATLKRIYRQGADGYRLEAEHPDYPALRITEAAVWYDDAPPPAPTDAPPDVRVLGLLVGQLSEAVFPIEPSV